MDIEKLYQDVWARVFAQAWLDYDGGPAFRQQATADLAEKAAADAVGAWDPALAHKVIAAKGVS